MSARRRVAVVGGGANCEHDVSLASAAAVSAALDPRRYDVLRLIVGTDGHWSDPGGPLGTTVAESLAEAVLRLGRCDAVFPVLHGPRGEDGTLAALCELADVPYVGSGVRAGALAMDKWATKLVAAALGLRVAPGYVLTQADLHSAVWERPVVVKPVAAGSSYGVAVADRPESFVPALTAALRLDDRVLVEEVVVGRELDVAVLEDARGVRRVAPVLEVVTEGLFDTAAKYDGSAVFQVPADIDDTLRTKIAAAARDLFAALGCAGIARFDFFATADGLLLNEVNTCPGLTRQSQAPRMLAAMGIDYPQMLDALIAGARRPSARTGPGAAQVDRPSPRHQELGHD